ncbi:MAG: hypothetical protein HOP12_06185 [Candidatus Eisenbacteria bacterium]|uniref:DUF3108 domain-containing protein n=1 Tax=Eiseniibacteriota bacterium TaxID=2212470 RepID=A0A849SMB4_UNCEI|nr:hypothetical protein [Candidatus Eisenbacteria bacterium]
MIPSQVIATGRYQQFFAGEPCGDEVWRLETGAGEIVVAGEHTLVAPHPLPNVHRYRVALSAEWRVKSLDVEWQVGGRELVANHAVEGTRWRAHIESQGHARSQEGDYPLGCEVEYPTHLFNTFMLSKRDFALGGEHEFAVLRIGPPLMAVSPAQMLLRCVEHGTVEGPNGPVAAKRYVLSVPPAPESEGYTFWADEHDIVLASFEGLDTTRPWMTLVEYQRL